MLAAVALAAVVRVDRGLDTMGSDSSPGEGRKCRPAKASCLDATDRRFLAAEGQVQWCADADECGGRGCGIAGCVEDAASPLSPGEARCGGDAASHAPAGSGMLELGATRQVQSPAFGFVVLLSLGVRLGKRQVLAQELSMRCDGSLFGLGSRWEEYADKFGAEARGDSTRHFFDAGLEDCAASNKNVLWLYPSEDHNGAFAVDGSVCSRLLSWYDTACSVHVWRVRTVLDAEQVLAAYEAESLMAVVLGGHGLEGSPDMQWGPSEVCGEGYLCGQGRKSRQFIRYALGPKLARHATVFLDSCYGGLNGLVQIFADNIGKGISVHGGDNSFSTVEVDRFGIGHHIESLEGAHVVEVQARGAACPRWAKSSEPDGDGDCECPDDKPRCRVADGGKCPISDGRFEQGFFDPSCATFGTCKCHEE